MHPPVLRLAISFARLQQPLVERILCVRNILASILLSEVNKQEATSDQTGTLHMLHPSAYIRVFAGIDCVGIELNHFKLGSSL